MNKKKPDALLVLAVIFGLGILVSTLTHGNSADDRNTAAAANAVAASAANYGAQ